LTDGGDPSNIPIVMVSNNITDKYDGDFNNRRLHIASFNFVAKSYIFGGVKSTTTIQSDSIVVDLEE
jgi:hypothetical protein